MTLQELLESLRREHQENANQVDQQDAPGPVRGLGTNDLTDKGTNLDNQSNQVVDDPSGLLWLVENFWLSLCNIILSQNKTIESTFLAQYNILGWCVQMKYSPQGIHMTCVSGPQTNVVLKHVTISPTVIRGYIQFLLDNGYNGLFAESKNNNITTGVVYTLEQEV